MGDKMNPLARTTDPDTSHMAARRALLFGGSHRVLILACLRLHGNMTAHEMEKHTGLSYVQIDRRMHELVKAKLVIDSGVRRATPTGGKAIVWSLI
jgi:DNA-binding transcriptional regulator GbsR (MarR family)